MNDNELKPFGQEYAAACSSGVPELPFSFQAEECVLTITDGEPTVTAGERLAAIAGSWRLFRTC